MQFGTVACVNGTFDCKKGRVFVSYKEKQGALNALETMLITKEYHLQVEFFLFGNTNYILSLRFRRIAP